jgi:hypothetical protein
VPRLDGEKEIIDMNMVAIFGRTDHVLFGHTVLLPHLGADYFTAICTRSSYLGSGCMGRCLGQVFSAKFLVRLDGRHEFLGLTVIFLEKNSSCLVWLLLNLIYYALYILSGRMGGTFAPLVQLLCSHW